MKHLTQRIIACFLTLIFIGCDQKISLKNSKLTGINPVSVTDVIYKGNRDTVITSTFDGKIREVIRNQSKENVIIDLNEEIYSLAYDPNKRLIYASTLHSGIVIINEDLREVEDLIPLKKKWSKYVAFNSNLNILMASDYGGNSYVWSTTENHQQIDVPVAFSGMSPKLASGAGMVYFDGSNEVGIWNFIDKTILPKIRISGQLVDVDEMGNILMTSYDTFILYSTSGDSIIYENKHPDWPIYVESQDTIYRAPVSMPINGAILSISNIYTSSVDRTVRKWSRQDGGLVNDLLGHRATISAMDITKDQTQLVSADLKGAIKFWEINN